jgi:lysine-ketoglutarate reductase/saccharopine dehydrogenase-like protein (TIGR00300 family)
MYVPPDFTAAFLAEAPEVSMEPAPAEGIVPKTFYATTNFPTYVKHGGQWHLVRRQRMDAALVLDPTSGNFEATEMRNVRAGQPVIVGSAEDGSTGVLVYHTGFRSAKGTEAGGDAFGFMSTGPSRERPLNYRRLAELVRSHRNELGHSIWVLGPAVVHSGAREAMSWLIDHGYVTTIFGGNAVATHDIESALYGTALGMDLEGQVISGGHRHHMDAINAVRLAGSIEAAVETGLIKNGIMHSAVKAGVNLVLAGSIRDDGPLPGVITDAIEAQIVMRRYTQETTLVVMLATMLHSIATGNMMPTFIEQGDTLVPVYTIVVDQSENVISKLIDRGTHQAVGVVRNADDFLVRLAGELEKLEAAETHATKEGHHAGHHATSATH